MDFKIHKFSLFQNFFILFHQINFSLIISSARVHKNFLKDILYWKKIHLTSFKKSWNKNRLLLKGRSISKSNNSFNFKDRLYTKRTLLISSWEVPPGTFGLLDETETSYIFSFGIFSKETVRHFLKKQYSLFLSLKIMMIIIQQTTFWNITAIDFWFV